MCRFVPIHRGNRRQRQTIDPLFLSCVDLQREHLRSIQQGEHRLSFTEEYRQACGLRKQQWRNSSDEHHHSIRDNGAGGLFPFVASILLVLSIVANVKSRQKCSYIAVMEFLDARTLKYSPQGECLPVTATERVLLVVDRRTHSNAPAPSLCDLQ